MLGHRWQPLRARDPRLVVCQSARVVRACTVCSTKRGLDGRSVLTAALVHFPRARRERERLCAATGPVALRRRRNAAGLSPTVPRAVRGLVV